MEKLEGIAGCGRIYKDLSESDVEAIASAIEINEKNLREIFKEIDAIKEEKPLTAMLAAALSYGDKGACGVGPISLARRAEFSGGERIDKGDLKDYKPKLESVLGKSVEDDVLRVYSFVIEGLRRIYLRKPSELFNRDKMWRKVRELREIEIEVTQSAAMWIIDKLTMDFKSLLESAVKSNYPLVDEHVKAVILEKHKLISSRYEKEDVVNWILSLAYRASQPEKAESYISKVRSEELLRWREEYINEERWKKVSDWLAY